MKKRCEFCGKITKTTSTMFNGEYCVECYEILIEQSKEAIAKIKNMKY